MIVVVFVVVCAIVCWWLAVWQPRPLKLDNPVTLMRDGARVEVYSATMRGAPADRQLTYIGDLSTEDTEHMKSFLSGARLVTVSYVLCDYYLHVVSDDGSFRRMGITQGFGGEAGRSRVDITLPDPLNVSATGLHRGLENPDAEESAKAFRASLKRLESLAKTDNRAEM